MKHLTKKDMSTALTFWYILKKMMHTTSCSSNMCYTLIVAIQVLQGSFFVMFQYASTLPNAHTLLLQPGKLSQCRNMLLCRVYSLCDLHTPTTTNCKGGKSEHVDIFPYRIANPIHSPTAQNAPSCFMLWFPTQCLTMNDFFWIMFHTCFSMSVPLMKLFNIFVIQLLTLYQTTCVSPVDNKTFFFIFSLWA